MAKTFDEIVKETGSVSAALASQGYSKGSDGTWRASGSGGSSGGSSAPSSGSSGGSSGGSNAGYHFDYSKNPSGGWTQEEMDAGFSKPSSNNSGGSSIVSGGSSGGSSLWAPQQSTSSPNYGANRVLNDKGYDPNIDYSVAIKNATDAAVIAQLQAERQNKVNDLYGGSDPYNTASKVYGSSWTPQSATVDSNQAYNAQQAEASTQFAEYLTQKVASGAMTQRDADLAWAQAGGTVNYDNGTPAWSLGPQGFNTSADLSDAALQNMAMLGDWDGVDEILRQRQLRANAAGVSYDPIQDWYMLNKTYGGPSAGMSLAEMYQGSQQAYGDSGWVSQQENTTPATQVLTSLPLSGVSGGGISGGSSVSTGSDASQYLRDMIAQQAAAELAALKSTYEQNILDYESQDDLISAEAQRQRNRAAAQNDLQRMYMNEMGIMHGLNTGATGQMALAQSAALQGSFAEIGTQEQQALADSALERSKLKVQYSAAVDQAIAQNNYELANALYQEYVRQDNLAQQAAAAAQEQANWQAKFDYQKQQDAWNNAAAQAELLAGFGDFSGYKALGYSDAQIAMMRNAWNAQYGTPAVGTTGTTSTSPTSKNTGWYDNGSLSTDLIKRMQEYINSGIDNPSEKIAVDGKWGPATQEASGGFTAEEFLPAYYRFNSWSGRSDR